MSHWLNTAIDTYLTHPLKGNGYQWWSGAGSDLGELTLLVAILATAKHHNCHSKGCWRPGHRHPDHGWPSCKRHWMDTPTHVNDEHSLR